MELSGMLAAGRRCRANAVCVWEGFSAYDRVKSLCSHIHAALLQAKKNTKQWINWGGIIAVILSLSYCIC